MPNGISGVLTAKPVLPRWPFKVRPGAETKLLVLTTDQERKEPYFLIGDPTVQVATQPGGSDAVDLIWEVNDLIPYDARRYQARTAIFTPYGQKQFLVDKSFEILVSPDGKTFSKIADVPGPTNRYVHAGVEKGRLYYYKVRAFDKDGKLLAESPVTMGAAGPNLFHEDSYQSAIKEQGMASKAGNPALSIIQGARPYSQAKPILRFQPSARSKQVSFFGNLIPLSPDKTYLQGGWVRAPGNVWHGRYFHDADGKGMCWAYSMMAVRNTPEWTFSVQLLSPDKDGTGFRRKEGRPYSVAQKQWTFPPEASYMTVFVTTFAPGEAGDFWIVELSTEAPGVSSP